MVRLEKTSISKGPPNLIFSSLTNTITPSHRLSSANKVFSKFVSHIDWKKLTIETSVFEVVRSRVVLEDLRMRPASEPAHHAAPAGRVKGERAAHQTELVQAPAMES